MQSAAVHSSLASRSFQHAVGLLDVYTRCGANFVQLKAAYTSSSRAHAAEQRTLREVWAAAAAAIGHMAAQVVDTGMLQELAAHDAAAAPQGEPAQLCRNATSFLEAAAAAVRKGFFGQTVRQLDTLLTEMALLRQRPTEADSKQCLKRGGSGTGSRHLRAKSSSTPSTGWRPRPRRCPLRARPDSYPESQQCISGGVMCFGA